MQTTAAKTLLAAAGVLTVFGCATPMQPGPQNMTFFVTSNGFAAK